MINEKSRCDPEDFVAWCATVKHETRMNKFARNYRRTGNAV